MPVHFRDYYTSVRGRTRDYQKLSRMKVPLNGEIINLAEDYRPVRREAWSHEYISIPEAKLMIDTQPAWY